jgi:hypothetical protein
MQHIVGINRLTLGYFCQTAGNLKDTPMGDDGRRARKVPGELQRDLVGDLKAIEEPGSSVIRNGISVCGKR